MNSLLVITNRDAGSGHPAALDAALAVLEEGADVEVAATGGPDELDDVLGGADGRRIVVAGGDGSLHAVVAGLHGSGELTGQELGLLPLGTGNDFARGVGIPLDIEEAARVVLTGHPAPMDLLVDDSGDIVVNGVHVGAGAAAASEGAGWKSRLGRVGVGRFHLGRLGYPIGALRTAWNPPVLRLRVEVDGAVVQDVDQPVLMVAVGNGRSVGGGTELTPDAEPGDALADVMVSRATGPLARLLYAAHLGFATHQQRDDVTHVRGREVTVNGEEFRCSADGEVSEPARRRRWRIEPAAYSLLLPR